MPSPNYRIVLSSVGRGVAEWARELTGDRTVNGSSPAAVKKLFASLRNFGNSVYPALPVSFG